MKEALSTFNGTVKRNTPQPIPKEDDDCDLYAKLLATKLRKLPEGKKLRFMHDIDGMYMQYAVHSESSSPVPTPSPQSQHASQFILSRKSSHDQYQQRPGTSSSSHSEPIIHYSPNSNINIQSNDVIYPPVIHISDSNTSAEIGTVTYEGLISPNSLIQENNRAASNIINEAFQLCDK